MVSIKSLNTHRAQHYTQHIKKKKEIRHTLEGPKKKNNKLSSKKKILLVLAAPEINSRISYKNMDDYEEKMVLFRNVFSSCICYTYK
jgi:transglutaminase/protease-like cytokinesis protein 3